jgi:hypothetical protein
MLKLNKKTYYCFPSRTGEQMLKWKCGYEKYIVNTYPKGGRYV